MATNNNTILSKIYIEGSNDYQQRTPDPSQYGMQQVSEALFSPMNNVYYNDFCSALIGRIGNTIVKNKSWENPLAVFKSGKLNYGTTIQEIGAKWIQAHAYDIDEDTLLRVSRPEVAAAYHSINRKVRYDISVSKIELRKAFNEEYGLNSFINTVLQVPINSDNYDEYKTMLQLIATHEANHGFYKAKVSGEVNSEETAKELLKLIKAYAGKLAFPSTLYNSNDVEEIPVFAKKDELVLFATPEVMASIDVDALASMLNWTAAETQIRMIPVDEFPVPGAQALLTTDDFFVCSDTYYGTESFYNPQNLCTNYYLHHQEIVSVSPFVPAILFTTGDATSEKSVVVTNESIALTAAAETVEVGGEVQLAVAMTGSVVPEIDCIANKPTAATFSVTAMRDTAAVELNSKTFVDEKKVLHVQRSGIQKGDKIKVVAYTTYINPTTGKKADLSAEVTVTVD